MAMYAEAAKASYNPTYRYQTPENRTGGTIDRQANEALEDHVTKKTIHDIEQALAALKEAKVLPR